MQQNHHFDYIIIGNGLAGLQLALGFLNDPFFNSKRIGLIDPSTKSTNDKTWSYWEEGKGMWDDIVYKKWEKALFKSKNLELSIPLNAYTYKTIRSSDFYKYAKQQLKTSQNFDFILDEILEIDDTDDLKAIGKANSYYASHIFDSRIPKEFFLKNSKYTLIHQHFKGWVIETATPCFQPEEFTMMDYRYRHQDSTSFIYVLPISETKALIEFTFFTPYTVEEPIYDKALTDYIHKNYKLHAYKILETEMGNIPMTDFPFWDFNTTRVTKIGTGGGWVKGSTGYSFKHTEKYVRKILNNIKAGMNPSSNLIRKNFKFYDSIFLDVLNENNEKGPWIFEQFYSKNNVDTMFRFLDEETTFKEDFNIMKSLFSMTFIKAFFRVLFRS